MQLAIRYTKFLLLPSLVLAAGLLLLNWMEYRLVLIENKVELYAGLIALLFLLLGYQLAAHLKAKSVENSSTLIEEENESTEAIDSALLFNRPGVEVKASTIVIPEGLSTREMEVLQLMAKGLSNQEISERLFISLSTVKTHCSSIYLKLDVKRRTGAVERARVLGLLA